VSRPVRPAQRRGGRRGVIIALYCVTGPGGRYLGWVARANAAAHTAAPGRSVRALASGFPAGLAQEKTENKKKNAWLSTLAKA